MSEATRRRWFFGPSTDLLLGAGLLYTAFFAAQILFGPQMREVLPHTLLPFLTLALGAPHYGATLLRVYAERNTRRRYAFFAVYLSALLLALYAWGLHSFYVGSLVVTVYLTWSPWHYTGQNYGVMILFLRRRKVAITAPVKRLLYGSFILSYALVFLMLHHTPDAVAGFAPGVHSGTLYDFIALGIPGHVYSVLFPALALAWAGCSAAAVALLMRRSRLRDLTPALVILPRFKGSSQQWCAGSIVGDRLAIRQGSSIQGSCVGAC
jgi:hypothetical protein